LRWRKVFHSAWFIAVPHRYFGNHPREERKHVLLYCSAYPTQITNPP
jgi:hypothetical protein